MESTSLHMDLAQPYYNRCGLHGHARYVVEIKDQCMLITCMLIFNFNFTVAGHSANTIKIRTMWNFHLDDPD